MKNLYLVSGSANPILAEQVANLIDVDLHPMDKLEKFLDDEWNVRYRDSLRGMSAFIIQPTCPPVNDTLMQLLIMVDDAMRASAASITAVIPYFGYARQDHKDRPRTPITAALVCKLLKHAGVNHLMALDLHSGQIQGFFDGPFDNVPLAGALLNHFNGLVKWKNVILMSPDASGVTRCQEAADILGCDVGFIRKHRREANISESMEVVGDVKDHVAILLDDMADTLGTLAGGSEKIAERGAIHIYAACTHGLLSGPAIKRLTDSPIEKLVISDSIPLPPEKQHPKIKVVSCAATLAHMIQRDQTSGSIADMITHSFDWVNKP